MLQSLHVVPLQDSTLLAFWNTFKYQRQFLVSMHMQMAEPSRGVPHHAACQADCCQDSGSCRAVEQHPSWCHRQRAHSLSVASAGPPAHLGTSLQLEGLLALPLPCLGASRLHVTAQTRQCPLGWKLSLAVSWLSLALSWHCCLAVAPPVSGPQQGTWHCWQAQLLTAGRLTAAQKETQAMMLCFPPSVFPPGFFLPFGCL